MRWITALILITVISAPGCDIVFNNHHTTKGLPTSVESEKTFREISGDKINCFLPVDPLV